MLCIEHEPSTVRWARDRASQRITHNSAACPMSSTDAATPNKPSHIEIKPTPLTREGPRETDAAWRAIARAGYARQPRAQGAPSILMSAQRAQDCYAFTVKPKLRWAAGISTKRGLCDSRVHAR